MQIRDGDSSDPGWKKSRIRDKHPGSATLPLNEVNNCSQMLSDSFFDSYMPSQFLRTHKINPNFFHSHTADHRDHISLDKKRRIRTELNDGSTLILVGGIRIPFRNADPVLGRRNDPQKRKYFMIFKTSPVVGCPL